MKFITFYSTADLGGFREKKDNDNGVLYKFLDFLSEDNSKEINPIILYNEDTFSLNNEDAFSSFKDFNEMKNTIIDELNKIGSNIKNISFVCLPKRDESKEYKEKLIEKIISSINYKDKEDIYINNVSGDREMREALIECFIFRDKAHLMTFNSTYSKKSDTKKSEKPIVIDKNYEQILTKLYDKRDKSHFITKWLTNKKIVNSLKEAKNKFEKTFQKTVNAERFEQKEIASRTSLMPNTFLKAIDKKEGINKAIDKCNYSFVRTLIDSSNKQALDILEKLESYQMEDFGNFKNQLYHLIILISQEKIDLALANFSRLIGDDFWDLIKLPGDYKQLVKIILKIDDDFYKKKVDEATNNSYKIAYDELSELIDEVDNDIIISNRDKKNTRSSLQDLQYYINKYYEITNDSSKKWYENFTKWFYIYSCLKAFYNSCPKIFYLQLCKYGVRKKNDKIIEIKNALLKSDLSIDLLDDFSSLGIDGIENETDLLKIIYPTISYGDLNNFTSQMKENFKKLREFRNLEVHFEKPSKLNKLKEKLVDTKNVTPKKYLENSISVYYYVKDINSFNNNTIRQMNNELKCLIDNSIEITSESKDSTRECIICCYGYHEPFSNGVDSATLNLLRCLKNKNIEKIYYFLTNDFKDKFEESKTKILESVSLVNSQTQIEGILVEEGDLNAIYDFNCAFEMVRNKISSLVKEYSKVNIAISGGLPSITQSFSVLAIVYPNIELYTTQDYNYYLYTPKKNIDKKVIKSTYDIKISNSLNAYEYMSKKRIVTEMIQSNNFDSLNDLLKDYQDESLKRAVTTICNWNDSILNAEEGSMIDLFGLTQENEKLLYLLNKWVKLSNFYQNGNYVLFINSIMGFLQVLSVYCIEWLFRKNGNDKAIEGINFKFNAIEYSKVEKLEKIFKSNIYLQDDKIKGKMKEYNKSKKDKIKINNVDLLSFCNFYDVNKDLCKKSEEYDWIKDLMNIWKHRSDLEHPKDNSSENQEFDEKDIASKAYIAIENTIDSIGIETYNKIKQAYEEEKNIILKFMR